MKIFDIKKLKTTIYFVIIGIMIFFSLFLSGFGERRKEDIFLSNYNSTGWNLKNIPSSFRKERHLLQISKKIESKGFEIAKKHITGDNSEDYFNLGTIKLLQAYDLAKQDDLSGLQQARVLISQANQDLEIAYNIQINLDLQKYIENNKKVAISLETIIETKTCYQEGGFLISEIANTLAQTNLIIDEQSKQLDILKNLNIGSGDTCISNLINIITNNQIQLINVKNDLTKKEKEYKNIIGEKINSPIKCKGSSFEDLIKKTAEAKKTMEEYFKQQQEVSQIMDHPSSEAINQLCNGSKNDSQLNESLSNSVSQMMKDLQKQSEKEKNKDTESEKNQGQTQQDQKNEGDKKEEGETPESKGNTQNKQGNKKNEQGDGETEYKDVLNQEERNILNQTEQNSNKLIQQIQQIKGQGNYNGYEYIKNLFNSFMGNEGDLKNLHQPEKDNKGNGTAGQTQRY